MQHMNAGLIKATAQVISFMALSCLSALALKLEWWFGSIVVFGCRRDAERTKLTGALGKRICESLLALVCDASPKSVVCFVMEVGRMRDVGVLRFVVFCHFRL